MALSFAQVVFDCHDAAALAEFWSGVLGQPVDPDANEFFATIGHGSGFLAVFIAGIILGDIRAPYKGEIERFHSSQASLGEIVAFTDSDCRADPGYCRSSRARHQEA